MLEDFGDAADSGRHDRLARAHLFEQRDGHRLKVRGEHGDVGGREQRVKFGPFDDPREGHGLAEMSRAGFERETVRAIAGKGEVHGEPVDEEMFEGVQQLSYALQAHQPSDEQELDRCTVSRRRPGGRGPDDVARDPDRIGAGEAGGKRPGGSVGNREKAGCAAKVRVFDCASGERRCVEVAVVRIHRRIAAGIEPWQQPRLVGPVAVDVHNVRASVARFTADGGEQARPRARVADPGATAGALTGGLSAARPAKAVPRAAQPDARGPEAPEQARDGARRDHLHAIRHQARLKLSRNGEGQLAEERDPDTGQGEGNRQFRDMLFRAADLVEPPDDEKDVLDRHGVLWLGHRRTPMGRWPAIRTRRGRRNGRLAAEHRPRCVPNAQRTPRSPRMRSAPAPKSPGWPLG